MLDAIVTVVGTFFFFQAEDGIRDLVRSRGLGDVYKRQPYNKLYQTDKSIMNGNMMFGRLGLDYFINNRSTPVSYTHLTLPTIYSV